SRYNPIVARLRSIEKPVIAALNGVAAGAGASLAFAADLRIGCKSASIVPAFINIGLIPDAGGTHNLQRIVGYAKAAEIWMLGEKVSAEEAYRIGLFNRLVEDDELMPKTMELARRLASMPTRGIGLTKRGLNRAWNATLDDQLEYEAFLQQTAGMTEDHREGVLAFIEKRAAEFKGR
ncbi:MAG: enoyl-CoA hydratase/isomerase family protein, partial [Planctomycetes bacterium]|nr:enoyl-CoA hydratase/isomerase family protein [Planctomycetota bacterium]